ncbi:chemotaxis protein CheW [Paramagnetospirillum magneticum]|uniref:Chemotaxis signal transduction protein n=1 Tax=Paramagnetospirillum magneticum (strain ATCC 700264 / AMB-1) TaxID=342108 RepID=Q2W5V9_PARM1|nr:chemotaxis protein CheW [Paramagnetospirillum magneticum]BAE50766.1 Chemotaxis signal transduction protein [Paramagnetospirillum magneticum AMB-1]
MMAPSSGDISGVVVFRLAGGDFGLPVETVREVVPVAWLDHPPHLSAMVEGVLNLGGQAVPVLRLARLLGIEGGQYGLDASILVMRPRQDEGMLGLLVEHVDGVRDMGEFSIMGLAARQSFNDCLVDVLGRDGRVVNLLAWDRILLEQERSRLAEFQVRSQARLDELTAYGP